MNDGEEELETRERSLRFFGDYIGIFSYCYLIYINMYFSMFFIFVRLFSLSALFVLC